MSESEEEIRWDWLFAMAENENERVVLSYWPRRPAGENLAVFWGFGTVLERQYELKLVADVTPSGGIHGHIIGQGSDCTVSVEAGQYTAGHEWIDGRTMRRFESWNCSFVLTPNETRIILVVNNPPKPK